MCNHLGMSLSVTHFTDPGCPWAYSASPDLAVLRWRYGHQLTWRHVMIGLAEDPQLYVDRGYTPARQATGYVAFRRYGMPFATAPKPRVSATSPACRALVAVRQAAPEKEWEALRALQFLQFCSPRLLDDPSALRDALAVVSGLDADAIVAALESPEVWEAYESDRAETRTAEGGPTHFQGKTFNSDGKERFTAPSLVLATEDGRSLEAGGFQPIEAIDVCVANLDRTLERRGPAEAPVAVLGAFDHALTTREISAVMAAPMTAPNDAAAEAALISATAEGEVVRESVGDGALWSLAAA
jgi:protein-disulfide isomerase-like protein with CxxC motif